MTKHPLALGDYSNDKSKVAKANTSPTLKPFLAQLEVATNGTASEWLHSHGFMMIKPDAFSRRHALSTIRLLERSGFEIVAGWVMRLTPEQALGMRVLTGRLSSAVGRSFTLSHATVAESALVVIRRCGSASVTNELQIVKHKIRVERNLLGLLNEIHSADEPLDVAVELSAVLTAEDIPELTSTASPEKSRIFYKAVEATQRTMPRVSLEYRHHLQLILRALDEREPSRQRVRLREFLDLKDTQLTVKQMDEVSSVYQAADLGLSPWTYLVFANHMAHLPSNTISPARPSASTKLIC